MQEFHKLVSGFHRFREASFLKEADFFAELSRKQTPKTLVIGCCDSRVDPSIIMHCRPGELFVVRNVAALVPPVSLARENDAVMAAVEYAVKHLLVENIVVMGHASCGGIHALMHPEGVKHDRYISGWVSVAEPMLARIEEKTGLNLSRAAEEGSVLLSIENLLSYDWIERRVLNKELKLHAWYYDLTNGLLSAYNTETENFEILERNEPTEQPQIQF